MTEISQLILTYQYLLFYKYISLKQNFARPAILSAYHSCHASQWFTVLGVINGVSKVYPFPNMVKAQNTARISPHQITL
jgi:hypothetical protein